MHSKFLRLKVLKIIIPIILLIFMSITIIIFNFDVNSIAEYKIRQDSKVKASDELFSKANEKNATNIDKQYDFVLNSKHTICNVNSSILLLAFVITSTDHFEQRNIIRNSWSNQTLFPQIKTVFMLGLSKSQEINEKIISESNKYNDIVQSNFIDTYLNLTIKTLSGFKWTIDYCPNAKFVMKVDDDVVVNSRQLISHLISLTDPINKIYCKKWSKAKIRRDQSDKFFVSKLEYEADYYPDYCDGPAYIMTRDVTIKLFNASLYIQYFKFEDVYITGILSARLIVYLNDFNSKYNFYKLNNSNELDYIDKEYIFFYTPNMASFVSVWNFIN